MTPEARHRLDEATIRRPAGSNSKPNGVMTASAARAKTTTSFPAAFDILNTAPAVFGRGRRRRYRLNTASPPAAKGV